MHWSNSSVAFVCRRGAARQLASTSRCGTASARAAGDTTTRLTRITICMMQLLSSGTLVTTERQSLRAADAQMTAAGSTRTLELRLVGPFVFSPVERPAPNEHERSNGRV